MNTVIATQKILEDTLIFLSKLNNKLYNQTIPVLFYGTIGKQTRYLIELYQCLLLRKNTTTVNYESRERNHLLETKLEIAKASNL